MSKSNNMNIKNFQAKKSVDTENRFYSNKFISNRFWKLVDIVASKSRTISNKYEMIIGEEYKKEYKQFGILNYIQVLHIGCGAYPLTEITLSSIPGRKIVGIDKNLKAVISAREIIRKKNLEKKVVINHGNGVIYPTNGFDLIIISSCSLPKDKILKNILNNADRKCIIIVREIDSAIDNIFDFIEKNENIRFLKKLRFKTRFLMKVFWYSLYLIKTK